VGDSHFPDCASDMGKGDDDVLSRSWKVADADGCMTRDDDD